MYPMFWAPPYDFYTPPTHYFPVQPVHHRPHQNPTLPAVWALHHQPAKELGEAQVTCDDDKFLVKCDVRQFSPEEVTVETDDGYLIIKGAHSDRHEMPMGETGGGGDGVRTSRKFCSKFLLPEGSDEDKLTCEIGYTGELKVTIPRKHEDPSKKTGRLHKILHAVNPLEWWGQNGHVPVHPHPPLQNYQHFQTHMPWLSGMNMTKEAFTVRLELPQFALHDITVKTRDDVLIIQGHHEEKTDTKSGHHGTISRSFTRKYLLPVNANVDGLTSEMDDEGVLKVVVPRTPAKEGEEEERSHPIVNGGGIVKKDEVIVDGRKKA